jgi:hypothetical protein
MFLNLEPDNDAKIWTLTTLDLSSTKEVETWLNSLDNDEVVPRVNMKELT